MLESQETFVPSVTCLESRYAVAGAAKREQVYDESAQSIKTDFSVVWDYGWLVGKGRLKIRPVADTCCLAVWRTWVCTDITNIYSVVVINKIR